MVCTMKRFFIPLLMLMLLSSHDLYFKTSHYFMKPDNPGELFLFNGTFNKSENSIERDRMVGSRIIGPDYDFTPQDKNWYDKNNVTFLKFVTGNSGTYSAGVSTKGRSIELSAEEFNDYLEHDGVLDVLNERKKKGILDKNAVELYAKHVKILFQVGTSTSEHFMTNFGYPLEFIPLSNPYKAKINDEISFELIKNSKPLKNHLVYFGVEGASAHQADDHLHEDYHSHDTQSAVTNDLGRFTVKIDHKGVWYIRTIHMVESTEKGIDYESNWATLTFEIR